LVGLPYSAFYSSTKFALEGYIEALWHELKPFSISASLIEPGFVRTAINQATRMAGEPITAYDGPRNRAIAVVDRSVDKGIAPEIVAQAVLHAAETRNPRLRYRVGADSRWLPRLKKVAPWNFFASGVRRTFELDSPKHAETQAPVNPHQAGH